MRKRYVGEVVCAKCHTKREVQNPNAVFSLIGSQEPPPPYSQFQACEKCRAPVTVVWKEETIYDPNDVWATSLITPASANTLLSGTIASPSASVLYGTSVTQPDPMTTLTAQVNELKAKVDELEGRNNVSARPARGKKRGKKNAKTTAQRVERLEKHVTRLKKWAWNREEDFRVVEDIAKHLGQDEEESGNGKV